MWEQHRGRPFWVRVVGRFGIFPAFRLGSAELRALAARVEALGDREQGCPPWPFDPKKEALQGQTQELQAKLEVLEQTERIRQRLGQPDKKSMRWPK